MSRRHPVVGERLQYLGFVILRNAVDAPKDLPALLLRLLCQPEQLRAEFIKSCIIDHLFLLFAKTERI